MIEVIEAAEWLIYLTRAFVNILLVYDRAVVGQEVIEKLPGHRS